MGRLKYYTAILTLLVPFAHGATFRMDSAASLRGVHVGGVMSIFNTPAATAPESVLVRKVGSTVVQAFPFPSFGQPMVHQHDSLYLRESELHAGTEWLYLDSVRVRVISLGGVQSATLGDSILVLKNGVIARVSKAALIAGIGAEPFISAGATNQYFRGDKTWQNLNVPAVSGLIDSLATKLAIQSLTVSAVSGLIDSLAAKLPLHGKADSSELADSVKKALAISKITGLVDSLLNHRTLINSKESSITAGTTSQYWRGDKAWQNLVVGAVTGLIDSLAAKLPLHGKADSTVLADSVKKALAISKITGLVDSLLNHRTLINSKEPSITAGTASQYWRGDKTWQNLVVGAVTGLVDSLSNKLKLHGKSDSTVLADSVKKALAIYKITGLVDSLLNHRTLINSKEPSITAGTALQYWRGDKVWQNLVVGAVTGLVDSLGNKLPLSPDSISTRALSVGKGTTKPLLTLAGEYQSSGFTDTNTIAFRHGGYNRWEILSKQNSSSSNNFDLIFRVVNSTVNGFNTMMRLLGSSGRVSLDSGLITPKVNDSISALEVGTLNGQTTNIPLSLNAKQDTSYRNKTGMSNNRPLIYYDNLEDNNLRWWNKLHISDFALYSEGICEFKRSDPNNYYNPIVWQSPGMTRRVFALRQTSGGLSIGHTDSTDVAQGSLVNDTPIVVMTKDTAIFNAYVFTCNQKIVQNYRNLRIITDIDSGYWRAHHMDTMAGFIEITSLIKEDDHRPGFTVLGFTLAWTSPLPTAGYRTMDGINKIYTYFKSGKLEFFVDSLETGAYRPGIGSQIVSNFFNIKLSSIFPSKIVSVLNTTIGTPNSGAYENTCLPFDSLGTSGVVNTIPLFAGGGMLFKPSTVSLQTTAAAQNRLVMMTTAKKIDTTLFVVDPVTSDLYIKAYQYFSCNSGSPITGLRINTNSGHDSGAFYITPSNVLSNNNPMIWAYGANYNNDTLKGNLQLKTKLANGHLFINAPFVEGSFGQNSNAYDPGWRITPEGGARFCGEGPSLQDHATTIGHAPYSLTVGPVARTDIGADSLVIAGTVRGELKVGTKLTLVDSARSFSSVLTSSLEAYRTSGVAGSPDWISMGNGFNGLQFDVGDSVQVEGKITNESVQGDSVEVYFQMLTGAKDGTVRYIKVDYSGIINNVGDSCTHIVGGTIEDTVPANTKRWTGRIKCSAKHATTGILINATISLKVRRITASGTAPSVSPWLKVVGAFRRVDGFGSSEKYTK